MRWFHLTIIVLFVATVVVFAVQNADLVSVSLLRMNARMPLALLVAIIYLLGAATGGSLFALLRRSFEGARHQSKIGS